MNQQITMAVIKFDLLKISKLNEKTSKILKLEWVERSSAQELRKFYDRGKFDTQLRVLHQQEINNNGTSKNLETFFLHL